MSSPILGPGKILHPSRAAPGCPEAARKLAGREPGSSAPAPPPGLARFPGRPGGRPPAPDSRCLRPRRAGDLGPAGRCASSPTMRPQLPRDGGHERGRVCPAQVGAPGGPALQPRRGPRPARTPARAPQRPPTGPRAPAPGREERRGLRRPRRRPPAGCTGAAGTEPPSGRRPPLARRRAARSSPGHPETGEAGPAPNTMPGRPAAAKRSPSQQHRLRAAGPEVAGRGLCRSRPRRPQQQLAL